MCQLLLSHDKNKDIQNRFKVKTFLGIITFWQQKSRNMRSIQSVDTIYLSISTNAAPLLLPKRFPSLHYIIYHTHTSVYKFNTTLLPIKIKLIIKYYMS